MNFMSNGIENRNRFIIIHKVIRRLIDQHARGSHYNEFIFINLWNNITIISNYIQG